MFLYFRAPTICICYLFMHSIIRLYSICYSIAEYTISGAPPGPAASAGRYALCTSASNSRGRFLRRDVLR